MYRCTMLEKLINIFIHSNQLLTLIGQVDINTIDYLLIYSIWILFSLIPLKPFSRIFIKYEVRFMIPQTTVLREFLIQRVPPKLEFEDIHVKV